MRVELYLAKEAEDSFVAGITTCAPQRSPLRELVEVNRVSFDIVEALQK